MHPTCMRLGAGGWGLRFVIALAAGSVIPMVAPAHAAIEISTDHRQVSFGLMELGEEKILAHQGAYHNDITCSSTNGQSWYVKISVLQPLTSGAETIPLEQFHWQARTSNGQGTLARQEEFTPFSLVPSLVYLSGPNEVTGQRVTLQFRYRLQIPERQVSGIYSTTIRFTLTELL